MDYSDDKTSDFFDLSDLLFQSIKKVIHPHSMEAVDTWLKTATDKGLLSS